MRARWIYYKPIDINKRNGENIMTKFNAKEVASFISSQTYVQFEYQVRGKVASHFGVTERTAARWVERVISAKLISRSGKAALSVV